MRHKVYVIEKGDRGFVFRWRDRGRNWRQRKCDARTRRSAERAARDLEDELSMPSPSHESFGPKLWGNFCSRYKDEHLKRTSNGNQAKWSSVCVQFSSFIKSQGWAEPLELPMEQIDLGFMISFEAWLERHLGSSASVDSYLKTLRAGLSFAAEIGWLDPIPRRRKRNTKNKKKASKPKMKGRPVVGEEVERLVWAVDKELEEHQREGFKEIIQAYWHGGLRLSEPLDFHWTDLTYHVPLLDGPFPKVAFSELQKSGEAEEVTITSEFANLLLSIRKEDGWVFNPLGKPGERLQTGQAIGRVMRTLAIRAGLVLSPATEGRKAVYLTAQNLRQGLAYRLCQRGASSATLKHIMRHSDWKTTMLFYSGQGAREAHEDMLRCRPAVDAGYLPCAHCGR